MLSLKSYLVHLLPIHDDAGCIAHDGLIVFSCSAGASSNTTCIACAAGTYSEISGDF
jgi:hypothetical protein